MPFPEDRGWKDTVWVDGQVELLVYFGYCLSWAHFLFYFNSQTLKWRTWGSIGQLLVNPVPYRTIQCPTERWGIEKNYQYAVFIVYQVEGPTLQHQTAAK